MQGTEFKADDVRVSDKHCMGCERFDSDIMLTIINKREDKEHSYKFTDIFLSTEQAEKLLSQLEEKLQYNKGD